MGLSVAVARSAVLAIILFAIPFASAQKKISPDLVWNGTGSGTSDPPWNVDVTAA